MARFEKDTAVTPIDNGRYRAKLDLGWWIIHGPNGGYLTAILLRAIQAHLNDPERTPRSLTIHFLAAASEGEVEIEVETERIGGSVATLQARIVQGGRPIAIAIAALSRPRSPYPIPDATMPRVLAPEEIERSQREIPVSKRFDIRFLPTTESVARPEVPAIAGWIRLDEPQVLDYPLLGAYTDSLPPAIFSLFEEGPPPVGMPTVELTIHFHATVPRPQDKADDYCLSIMRAGTSHQGFISEDAEIWSRDGQLLASARQLAAIVRE